MSNTKETTDIQIDQRLADFREFIKSITLLRGYIDSDFKPSVNHIVSYYEGQIKNMEDYQNLSKEEEMPSVQNYINQSGNIITFKQYYGLADGNKKDFKPYYNNLKIKNNAKEIIEKHGAAKSESVKEASDDFTDKGFDMLASLVQKYTEKDMSGFAQFTRNYYLNNGEWVKILQNDSSVPSYKRFTISEMLDLFIKERNK